MTRIVIIGQGKMALDCARLAAARAEPELVAVVCTDQADRRLTAFCHKESLPIVSAANPNDPEAVETVNQLAPDFLLSVNNYRLLKQPLLQTARRGALNFHNGPLPRYAGVNIPTWSIWHGEARHGVTWHHIDDGIDTGAIAAQTWFDLAAEETAASLTFRCITAGTELFPSILDDLAADRVGRQAQDGARSYFAARDVPNGGFVELSWKASVLSRFLRAMDFAPFPSPFGPLKLAVGSGRDLKFRRGSLQGGGSERPDAAAGTIVGVEQHALRIRTADAELRLEELLGPSGAAAPAAEICAMLGLDVGAVLPTC